MRTPAAYYFNLFYTPRNHQGVDLRPWNRTQNVIPGEATSYQMRLVGSDGKELSMYVKAADGTLYQKLSINQHLADVAISIRNMGAAADLQDFGDTQLQEALTNFDSHIMWDLKANLVIPLSDTQKAINSIMEN